MTDFRTAVREDGHSVSVEEGVLPDGWRWEDELERTRVRPSEVLKGDRFMDGDRLVWIATENAEHLSDVISVRIQYPDGGLTDRLWDVSDPLTFEVQR